MGKETWKSSERLDEPPLSFSSVLSCPRPQAILWWQWWQQQEPTAKTLLSLSVLTMFGPDMTVVEVKQFVARQKMGDQGARKYWGDNNREELKKATP